MTQAPAGWYPQDDGRLRYWDGELWTEHVAPVSPTAATPEPGRLRAAVQGAIRSATSTNVDVDPEALWQSVGKPLSGLGAGRYKVTSQYLFVERGVLSTDAQQVPIASVVDVEVKQSLTQKPRGVGNLVVRAQGDYGVRVVVLEDITDFREGQRVINEAAHAARLVLQQRANTHRTENVHLVGNVQQAAALVQPSVVPVPGLAQPQAPAVGSLPAAPPSAPEPAGNATASASDPIEQLRQLAQLRDVGIVTQEEFDAKKAEILSRM